MPRKKKEKMGGSEDGSNKGSKVKPKKKKPSLSMVTSTRRLSTRKRTGGVREDGQKRGPVSRLRGGKGVRGEGERSEVRYADAPASFAAAVDALGVSDFASESFSVDSFLAPFVDGCSPTQIAELDKYLADMEAEVTADRKQLFSSQYAVFLETLGSVRQLEEHLTGVEQLTEQLQRAETTVAAMAESIANESDDDSDDDQAGSTPSLITEVVDASDGSSAAGDGVTVVDPLDASLVEACHAASSRDTLRSLVNRTTASFLTAEAERRRARPSARRTLGGPAVGLASAASSSSVHASSGVGADDGLADLSLHPLPLPHTLQPLSHATNFLASLNIRTLLDNHREIAKLLGTAVASTPLRVPLTPATVVKVYSGTSQHRVLASTRALHAQLLDFAARVTEGSRSIGSLVGGTCVAVVSDCLRWYHDATSESASAAATLPLLSSSLFLLHVTLPNMIASFPPFADAGDVADELFAERVRWVVARGKKKKGAGWTRDEVTAALWGFPADTVAPVVKAVVTERGAEEASGAGDAPAQPQHRMSKRSKRKSGA